MASNISSTEDYINILLLGEEDDKRCFLNSLANYVEYRSVGEFLRFGAIGLVPENTTNSTDDDMLHPYNTQFCSTPGPKYEDVSSYFIGRPKKYCIVNLVGANGMETIISHYSHLHSILIVLQDDISKAVEYVDFVKRNFQHVGNSVLKSISYILLHLWNFDRDLKELISLKVPVAKECKNVYSINSSIFSNLAKEAPISKEKDKIWTWCRKQCFELLSYVQQLRPCNITKEFPTWEIDQELQEVLAEISVVLQLNLLKVESTIQGLSKKDEGNDMVVSLDHLEKATAHGRRALICMSKNCSTKTIGHYITKSGYSVCHIPCCCEESCKEIVVDLCRSCHCESSHHVKVKYIRNQIHQVVRANGNDSIRDKLQLLHVTLEKERNAILQGLATIQLIRQKGQQDTDYYISFIGQELKRINTEDDAVYSQLKHKYVAMFAYLPGDFAENISEYIQPLYNLEFTGQMLRNIFATNTNETDKNVQKATEISRKSVDLPQVHSCSSQNKQIATTSYSKVVEGKASKVEKKREDTEKIDSFNCDEISRIIENIATYHVKIAEVEENLRMQNESIRSDVQYIKGYLNQNRDGSSDQMLKMFEEIEASIF